MADDTTAPNGGTAPDLDAWVAGIRAGHYAFRGGVAKIQGQALPVVFGIAPPGFAGKPETWAENVLPDVVPPAFLEEPYPRLTFAQEVARDWGADPDARKARYEALTEKEAGTTPLLYLRALCDGIREDMPRLAEDVYGAKMEARAALLTVLACLPEAVAEDVGLDAGALVDCVVDGGDVDECAADLSASIASAFSSNPSAAMTARALLGGLRGYDDVDAFTRGAVEYAAQQARESAPLLRRAVRMFERYVFARAELSSIYAGGGASEKEVLQLFGRYAIHDGNIKWKGSNADLAYVLNLVDADLNLSEDTEYTTPYKQYITATKWESVQRESRRLRKNGGRKLKDVPHLARDAEAIALLIKQAEQAKAEQAEGGRTV